MSHIPLREAADLIERLESELAALKEESINICTRNLQIRGELERAEAALKFYAAPSNWQTRGGAVARGGGTFESTASSVDQDKGQRARRALGK